LAAEIGFANAYTGGRAGPVLSSTIGKGLHSGLDLFPISSARAITDDFVRIDANLKASEAARNSSGFLAFSTGRATVYRVDTAGFPARVLTNKNGAISIPTVLTKSGDERALFVGFNKSRAEEFLLINRGGNGTISSFEVPTSVLRDITSRSSLEGAARTGPLRVDISKAPAQFGLRESSDIDLLRRSAIQGTGN